LRTFAAVWRSTRDGCRTPFSGDNSREVSSPAAHAYPARAWPPVAAKSSRHRVWAPSRGIFEQALPVFFNRQRSWG
jgi:hypothetical protein